MNREEYMKCKTAAKLYRDKFEECEMLKRRNDQLARENRLLKERLGYRRTVDAKYSQADAEVFLIVKMNHVR
jgi:cell shape-determining protein MreC